MFAGDWEAYARFGGSLENLAEYSQTLGAKIQRGANAVDQEWDGNAADAAWTYFSGLAFAISAQQVTLRELSEDYHNAARGVWLAATTVQGLLQQAIDKAIIAGVSAAAGTATLKTVVGPILGYAVAAWQAAEILRLVQRASRLIQTVTSLVTFFAGTIIARVHAGGDLDSYPLPESPYEHPAAG